MPLPAIIGIASAAYELFTKGQAIYESVAGQKSSAQTPTELQAELQALTPEQLAAWEKQMEMPLREFEAQTRRLIAEQGEVNAETLTAIPKEAAARVAILRMTTRPWVVRLCARGLVYPPLAVLTIDGALTLANTLSTAFGWLARLPVIEDGEKVGEIVQFLRFDLLGPQLLGAGASFTDLYSWFAPMAASVIGSYFGLREIGKAKRGDQTTIGEISDAAGNLLKMAKRVF